MNHQKCNQKLLEAITNLRFWKSPTPELTWSKSKNLFSTNNSANFFAQHFLQTDLMSKFAACLLRNKLVP